MSIEDSPLFDVINNGNLKNTDPGYLSWLSENPGNIVMGQKDIYKDLWDEKY